MSEKRPPKIESQEMEEVILPDEEIEKIVGIIGRSHHEGPIPDAASFAEYEKTLPGAADRILRMAEKHQEHYFEMSQYEMQYEYRGQFVGRILGFFALAILLFAGTLIAYFGTETGHFVFATACIGAATLSAVKKLIDGRKK